MDRDLSASIQNPTGSFCSYLSRRVFLKGAASIATSIAFGGAVLSLSGCEDAQNALISTAGLEQAKRTVVDHAGRTVEIPAVADLKRVFATSALGQFFLIALDWKLLGATNSTFTSEDFKYLPEELGSLSNLGSLAANTLSPESLLLEDIQLVFSISSVALTEANITDADDIQKQTGIPVILVDASMDKIAEAFRFLGECLGVEERASELSNYCTAVYDKVTLAVGNLSEEEKIRLYYAEGDKGLNSETRNNQHAVVFELAGAINVCGNEDDSGLGMVPVSLEQVIGWDPEIIITRDSSEDTDLRDMILNSSSWAAVSAVQTGRVYSMPSVPFAWVDRPPAANRFLGVQWIANLLYPDLYDVDMVEVVKDFYKLFYYADISDDDARSLLGSS